MTISSICIIALLSRCYKNKNAHCIQNTGLARRTAIVLVAVLIYGGGVVAHEILGTAQRPNSPSPFVVVTLGDLGLGLFEFEMGCLFI